LFWFEDESVLEETDLIGTETSNTFFMTAKFFNAKDGNIIDLFGGLEDLKNKILKTPRDAKLTMMDDPLRILRALRFCVTKQFAIDPTIINAMMQQNIQDKLFSVVSQDRIREELTKMFKYSTSKSLRLLYKLDRIAPTTFMDRLFSNGLWLKPTNEKIK
jgi:tRNA nucleotidyltransferase/poly(A) polymerase